MLSNQNCFTLSDYNTWVSRIPDNNLSLCCSPLSFPIVTSTDKLKDASISSTEVVIYKLKYTLSDL